ncbi:MAG: hypothetical protein BMS9Abin25_0352 [Gammaproteobacteria bacterium]|nr:MAG: hypothetical protein BMS9Abin25_0352 [Gammaproteobacteria bacterium]
MSKKLVKYMNRKIRFPMLKLAIAVDAANSETE